MFSLRLWGLVGASLFAGCSSKAPPPPPPASQNLGSVEPAEVDAEGAEDFGGGWLVEDEYGYLDMSLEALRAEPLQEYIDSDQLEQAQALLKRLKEEEPENAAHHYYNGVVLLKMGAPAKAVEEFLYVLRSNSSDFRQKAEAKRQKLFELAQEEARTLGSTSEEMLPEATFRYARLDWYEDPQTGFGFHATWSELQEQSPELKSRNYYLVSALQTYARKAREEKTWQSFYRHGFLNAVMRWFSDARKSLDKALSVADTQEQVFLALQLLNRLPKTKESELDKLSSLDLSEDMIDEFLSKHSKELNDSQMSMVKEVIREGMKIKEKLESARTDREKLKVLRQFMDLAESRISGQEFPPDVLNRVEEMRQKSETRFAELEEQIRVKEEALKG